MPIKNDFLTTAKRIKSFGTGSIINPTRIVLHYTAVSSLSGAVSALKSAGLSYNISINKNRSFHQARAFNRRAGHAGRSNWKEQSDVSHRTTLNADSIGISLVNLGMFGFFKAGKWWHGFKSGNIKPPSIRDAKANKLSSIYAPDRTPHWEPYTKRQILSCEKLLNHYPQIEESIGHDDIAIGGKSDPGPALPVEQWRQKFGKQGGLGLAAKVNSPDGTLNLRDRPIHLNGKIIGELNQDNKVDIQTVTYASRSNSAVLIRSSKGRTLTGWASADIDGSNKHAGFVYMGFLDRNPFKREFSNKL